MTEHKDLLAAELLKLPKPTSRHQNFIQKPVICSVILYFQQATEKGQKAVALSLDMSTAKDTFNMRHNIFKLHRKNILDAKRQNQLAVDVAKSSSIYGNIRTY